MCREARQDVRRGESKSQTNVQVTEQSSADRIRLAAENAFPLKAETKSMKTETALSRRLATDDLVAGEVVDPSGLGPIRRGEAHDVGRKLLRSAE